MKLAYYIKSPSLKEDAGVVSLLDKLSAEGHTLVNVVTHSDLPRDAVMLVSIGGDGTFLSAAAMAAPQGIPVAGINFGRMGFLSEFRPDDLCRILSDGTYSVEERTMLSISGNLPKSSPGFALNEVSVSRVGASMLGVDVVADGGELPTYWADGLLVSTASGSTAYSLSVGGPICSPASKVLIIAPVSPHNLNVRPLVVPESTVVDLSMKAREASVRLTIDGQDVLIPSDSVIRVTAAPFTLRKVVNDRTNFMDALRSRLLWGADIRNR